MSHHSKELKSYAEIGLRTAEEWASVGRHIRPESVAHVETDFRGKAVSLFNRNQTHSMTKRETAAK